MAVWHRISSPPQPAPRLGVRGRVGSRGRIVALTQGGVLGLPMFLPPLVLSVPYWRLHKCVCWQVSVALLTGADLNPSR